MKGLKKNKVLYKLVVVMVVVDIEFNMGNNFLKAVGDIIF